jgi:hypothetical protein
VKMREHVAKVRLSAAFDAATEFVLEETSCPTVSDISNGWCEVWAAAVKRSAPFVEVGNGTGIGLWSTGAWPTTRIPRKPDSSRSEKQCS